MTDAQAISRPWHLWTIGILSALWNCGGAFDFSMTHIRNPDYMAAFTPELLAWVDRFPLWSIIAWGLGVWGAMAGSLLLLLRSRWAVTAFAVSLAGLVIVTFYQFGLSGMPESQKTIGGAVFSAVLWIVAILLLWYAIAMRRRGVLR